MTTNRNRVVVVGGGFAGVPAVKTLPRVDVDVTLIDCTNYHLFQPLSYQVATGSLSPGEIAVPVRQIFRREPRVRVVMGQVTAFDLNRREVIVSSTAAGIAPGSIPYDALVVAAGSSYSYFGHERWRSVALEVKSLDTSPHPSHSLSNRGLEGLNSKVRLISHPAYGFHSANALNRDDLPLLRWHPNRASHR